MTLTAGARLGPYEIVSAIGAGGMGEVYRAHDAKLARDIAIKVLPSRLADPSHIERFRREARAVAALTHPNIVTIHSVEEAGGLHFLTMELVEGRSLAGEIPPAGLALEQFLDIAIALTDALAAAHERGIVHRDLKPANVMIDRSGRVKVLDFGLAKDIGGEARSIDETRLDLTHEGTVVGTMPYMSPEQIEGKAVDARSDLFSLGVVLYELASGARPFVGHSSPTLMASILRDVPPPIVDRRPEWPGQLGRLIARCLEKHPHERIQTARDVHNELRALRRDHAIALVSPPAPSAAPKPTADGSRSGAARSAGLWIAVLPFTHRGADSDLAALAAGLTEDITGGLSRFPHLRVMARQSAARVAGDTTDLRSMGRQLGTRYLLEGSLRKAGSEVRVTTDLIDTDTGTHLWAEKYDRDLTSTSIFAVQDVLSDRVVATVGDTTGFLVRSMASGLRERSIGELTFSELKLRHYLYLQQMRLDEHARLREAFEQALAREPDHADGWACLAYLYMDEHMHHANPLPNALERQHQAARRAVDIDPGGQLGWASLAAAYFFARDLDAFRPAAERAIALNPLHTNVTALMGSLLAYAGGWDHGIDLVRRAMSLNSQHPGWYRAAIFNNHCRLGEYAAALQQVKQINIPEWYWTHVSTAVVCGHLGRQSEAQAALDVLRRINPAFGLAAAREDWEHWMPDAGLVDRLMDGLRKAGLSDPGAASPAASAVATGPAKTPSIAVLPFTNMSADPENEYFGDGLAEEILNALTRFDGLTVIARTSAFAFKGHADDVRSIADVLGVATVLAGSVRRSGNRIRVIAQLIDAASGSHLWSERYDREMIDIFAVQDEMAAAIVGALELKLGGGPVRPRHIPSLPAYEAFLKGKHYQYKAEPEALDRARDAFSDAVALDPAYPEAHVELGANAMFRWLAGSLPARAAEPLLRAGALRALELDPFNSLARCTLGVLAAAYEYDWKEVERHFRLAMTETPVLADVRALYAYFYLLAFGRGQEAVHEMEQVLERDPLNVFWRAELAELALIAGMADRAIREARKGLEIDVTHWYPHFVLSQAYASQELWTEALAAAEHLYRLAPWNGRAIGLFAGIQVRSGNTLAADALIQPLRQAPPHFAAQGMMIKHLVCSEIEEAADWFEKAVDQREAVLPAYVRGPMFRELRASPRWPTLVRRMNLPEHT